MSLRILGLLTTLLILPYFAYSQCDDLQPEDSKFGYRERNGRCEGFYVANVSGLGIELVSFTYGKISYASNSNEKLKVSTNPLKDFSHISIRGANFSMDRNYRLDLEMRPGSQATVPIAEVIEPNQISSAKLGLYGFVEKDGFKYFVPVIPISVLSGRGLEQSKLLLSLASNVDVKSMVWSYAGSQFDRCGKYSDPIQLTPTSAIPRNTPITLEIPDEVINATEKTILCIQVTVEGTNGMVFHDNIRLLIPER